LHNMSDPLSFLESEAARIQLASLSLGGGYADEGDEDAALSDSDEEQLPNAMQALEATKQAVGDKLDEYEEELRKAMERADGQTGAEEEEEDETGLDAPVPADGEENMDGVFRDMWRKIRGKKKETPQDKLTRAKYKEDLAAAKRKKREAQAEGAATDAPLVFNVDVLTKEERAFADAVDCITTRGYALGKTLAGELMKLPKTAALLQATYAAASALAELRGEAEIQLKAAALKAGVDKAAAARQTEPSAQEAVRLAGHLAALGPSLAAAGAADERGKLLAHYLRSTAVTRSMLQGMVAALAGVVQLLQDRLSDGKSPKVAAGKLATFWATQGKVTDFHACVQQQFA